MLNFHISCDGAVVTARDGRVDCDIIDDRGTMTRGDVSNSYDVLRLGGMGDVADGCGARTMV